jgi:glycerol-3-phosphate dehydrogenase
MPIAEMVTGIVEKILPLRRKDSEDYNPEYKSSPVFAELSADEQDRLIQEDPDYGEVVCRCRMVTRAEVKKALSNSLGAKSITSIKNRVHTGMGRCQGGYCLTKIVETLVHEYGQKPEEIVWRKDGDAPFPGCVK